VIFICQSLKLKVQYEIASNLVHLTVHRCMRIGAFKAYYLWGKTFLFFVFLEKGYRKH